MEFFNQDFINLDDPTSINDGEVWDPDSQYFLDIGFDFEIYGTTYSSLVIDAGKGITFPGSDSRELWIWVSEWGGWPLLQDNGTDVSDSPISYQLTGDQGSRILKIQWLNAGIREVDGDDDPNDYINFQIWLLETSNKVEVHYGSSQTSDDSYGYNDGPGFRFWDLEGNYGICVWGFEDFPNWEYVLFEGPIGGCLLNGTPSSGRVFSFYPNPTVSIIDLVSNSFDFDVIIHTSWYSRIDINHYQEGGHYQLDVFDGQGRKVIEQILSKPSTIMNMNKLNTGIYIFVLRMNNQYCTKKVILN